MLLKKTHAVTAADRLQHNTQSRVRASKITKTRAMF